MKNTFAVEGMSCPHCKNAVEKAVRGVAGVSEAAVDLANGNVTATYDEGQTNLDQIKEAVRKAGYQPA